MSKTRIALVALALLLLVPAGASAQVAAELVGKYRMDVEGGDILELRSDGTAVMAGEPTRWSVRGKQLVVGTDVMGYVLQGDRLILTLGPVQLPWKRIGGAGKATVAAQSPPATTRPQSPSVAPAPATAGANPQDTQARQVLTGSAWCSFTYNKTSGTSTTRKVVFRPDGVMLVSGGAETYSSGYGGTVAGQSNSAGAMRWKLENQRLFVDQGGGAGFQDVGLTATQNSNGYPILHSQGREYSMCR
jgi:hypothetical protein